MTHLTNWTDKSAPERPRRLLALDGGGILGIITLGILREIERQLADASGEGDAFRLGRYFDYVGGTSTGAIIATGLAVGMSVSDLIDFYKRAGPLMFERRFLLSRLKSFYSADPLREQLREILGDRTLGGRRLLRRSGGTHRQLLGGRGGNREKDGTGQCQGSCESHAGSSKENRSNPRKVSANATRDHRSK